MIRSVFTDDFLLPMFLPISKVSSMLRHGSVRQVHSEECHFICIYILLTFFCCFLSKKIVFLSFSFLFLMKYRISATEY